MFQSDHTNGDSLLLMVAGAKGAVASTLAVALAAMRRDPASVLPSLTTGHMFAALGPLPATWLVGWDTSAESYTAAIKRHGVLPDAIWQPHAEDLDQIPVIKAPDSATDFKEQVDQLSRDINEFKSQHPVRGRYLSIFYLLQLIRTSTPVRIFHSFLQKLMSASCRTWPIPWPPLNPVCRS